jgi:hypothetical protein
MANLLHYRAWRGTFRSPLWSVWSIARVALGTLLRRPLFWVLYACGLLLFMMFFFGTFLLAWLQTMVATSGDQVFRGGISQGIIQSMQKTLSVLNGGQDTFNYFFIYQGSIVIVTLAFGGAILVGNDITFRSLVFYLAKPIHPWHYITGKCLATAIVVQMMTTLPALVLFAQKSLDDWEYLTDGDYFGGKGPGGIALFAAIVGYGTMLSVFLSILLVATASAMRRTMPLIMAWISLFFFPRFLAEMLVDGLKCDSRWRLIDLWNDLTLLGRALLGYSQESLGSQPAFWEAGLVLAGVCTLCLIYLNQRTRGVEVVR